MALYCGGQCGRSFIWVRNELISFPPESGLIGFGVFLSRGLLLYFLQPALKSCLFISFRYR